MKSIKFSFFIKYSVVFTLAFVLVNCKSNKVDVVEVPDFTKTFTGVTVTPVTITQPAPTTYTPPALVVPATLTTLAASATTTTPPPALTASVAKIDTTITKAAAAVITPTVIADIKAGKAVPANVEKALSDIIKTGALDGFFPKITPPTVDGTPINGRIAGASGSIDVIRGGTEMFSTANACNDAIKKAFDDAKKILDDALAAESTKITAAYTENIKAAALTTERQEALKFRNDQLAFLSQILDNALKNFPSFMAPAIVALYVENVKIVESFYSLAIKALDAKAKAITDKAAAARNADTKKVTDEYNAKLAAAQKVYDAENIKCHNQGGGN